MKLIRNVRIVDGGRIEHGSILIGNGKILSAGNDESINNISAENAEIIDGEGFYACAGFTDIHTHGAGGADYSSDNPDDFITACETQLKHGATSICPTTISLPTGKLDQVITAFKKAKKQLEGRVYLPGLHFEGPYLNPKQCGGMKLSCLRLPESAEYTKLVELADGDISRWSVAPELPGALELADYLGANGILISIAHSDATYEQISLAIDHGFSHVTHLYSCTSTITRRGGFRIPGVTESAYCFDELTVEIIADGCHLPPELLRMVVKCKGTDKISLITDSLSPAGTDVKTVELDEDGENIGIIEDGVIKLPDRAAFCGSIATADTLVRIMWKKAGVPLEDAIKMASENPAKVIGIDDKKGRLLPGRDADIVLFDENVNVAKVFYCGDAIRI